MPEVRHLHCERHELAAHRGELDAFRPDAVIDCRALTQADAEQALSAQPNVKRWIVISSIDVYRAFGALNSDRETDPVPIDEESAVRPTRYPYRGQMPDMDDYDKLDVEDVYLPHGATVLRLPMVYGEHDYQRREEFILRRVRAGRTRIPFGSGSWLACRVYVRDVGRAVRLALQMPVAGGVMNICEDRTYSMRMWNQAILDAAGSRAELPRGPDAAFDAGVVACEGGQQLRVPHGPRRFCGGIALFALAVFSFIPASPIVSVITERQWYDSLGYRDGYPSRVGLQAAVTIGSFVLAFVWLAINVVIALRVRTGGALRAVGIQRSALRTTAGWVSLGSAAVIALILSGGAYTQWQSLALFLHAQPTGTVDPVLGQDISFYLLTLPFLHAITNWSLGLDFLAILLIGALYSWRGDSFDFRPTPRAIAHVSVLIAAFAVTLAAGAWFGRYDLLYAHNSTVVWGAAYTDINARLPLYTFQAGAGIVLAGALVANAWLQRLWLPLVAGGAWVLLAIVSQVYPAVIQSVSVTPNAQQYELLYIQREIAGTQAAYGLSAVKSSTFSGDQPLTAQDVQNDQATINNLRLWDYTQLKETYEQQQTIRTYYTFHDIDIDRYTIGTQYQQLEISAREIDTSALSSAAKNWTNQHLQYTHGYGAAASPVNAVVGEGLPASVVGDLPPAGPLKISRPAIYFGEVPSDTDYDVARASVK